MNKFMANEYLTFKNFTSFASILSLFFGISLVAFPKDLLDLYDVPLSPEGYHVSKLFGAAFILAGLIAWSIRDLEPSDLRKKLSVAYVIGNGLGVILMLVNIFDNDTDANNMEWLNVVLYGIVAAGYTYFAFIETAEDEKVSSTS